MTVPGGLFDDLIPKSSAAPGGLFDDLIPQETEEQKQRREAFRGSGAGASFGPPTLSERLASLGERFSTTARAATGEALADIAGLGSRIGTPGAKLVETALRGTAAGERSTLTKPRGVAENVAQFAGEMAPGVAATMAGTGALRATSAGTGRAAAAARALLGPSEIAGTIPQQALGVLRQNVGGAIAALPISVPGALAEAPGRSPTGMLGVTNPAARVAGDVALDVLGGSLLEGGVRGGIGAVRGGANIARQLGEAGLDRIANRLDVTPEALAQAGRDLAGEMQGPTGYPEVFAAQQAKAAEQQAAWERLMNEPRSPLSQALEEFKRTMAGFGERPLEVPARPEVPPARTVQEGIDALRQPFVDRARAERVIAENASQVDADRERYRQIVEQANADRLAAQARAAEEEAQAQAAAEAAPTVAQRSALEALRRRAPGLALGLGQAALGGGVGYATGETPEEKAQYAAFGSMLAGIPGGRRELGAIIPQEVRSVGRFGFVKLPEGYVLDNALEAEHVARVMAAAEPTLSQIGARTEEAVNGAGLFGGDVSPNSILRFAKEATDDDVRTAAAVRGLAFGQDQQLWYRKARPTDANTTAAFVVTGPNFSALPDETIDRIVTRLRADDALGPYGGATRDGNHLLALNLKRYTGMDDAQFQQAVTRALDEVGQQFTFDIHPSTFYAEHLDGNADYARAIGRRSDALRAARNAIVDSRPEYLRYAQAVGADVGAVERELASRVESIDRLLRQVESPPPLGKTSGTVSLAEAAKKVFSKFPRIAATRNEVVVPEMVTRLESLVDDLVTQGVIPREMAQDWYRGATLDQRAIAQLAMPELREDPKYTLYTIVNSILSSGQQVPVESRQGLNVFDQYLRTGRFTILNPEQVEYRQALTGGKKALTGERGAGLLGEAMAASPRTMNHEQALARLDALVQTYGEKGAVDAILGNVPIMAGKVVKEERPALVYLFGPKIGQYAMDKLGMPGAGKSTIDLWMARLDYALRGDKSAIRGSRLNDAVPPTMRRRMQEVLAEFARRHNMPESSAQALAWYAIKNAFRGANATEKRLAYATLGSGTAEAILGAPGREFVDPIAQGLMRGQSYEQAAQGWDDRTLREFARRTGRAGEVAPTYGPFAGKAFDIGGVIGEGLRTPAGRRVMGQAGVGALGYGLSQSEDERLKATGELTMGLAAASFAYPALKKASQYGGIRIRDALTQTEAGRKVLNTLSYDILADPRVKQLVENAVEEMARYRAVGQQLAAEARRLGPQGDRVVSDLVERENFEQVMSPDDMAAATALANRVADAVQGLGRDKASLGLISPETLAKRERTYLRRMYGTVEGERAAEAAMGPEDFLTQAPQYGQGKTFRIQGEKVRQDLTPEQRLALGEIRESSYRIAETFGRGGRDVATARLFTTLADLPGAVEPRFKQAFDAAVEAKAARDAARSSGDAEAARQANQAYLAARQQMAQIAEEFSKGGAYVKMPDTPALGVLRGAVVRKDVADYLNNVPAFGNTQSVWNKVLSAWKQIHTVYNPGTHVGNFVSNAAMVHMGGLPLPMQPLYLAKAARGLRNYDPDVKFLTEAGILERGLPLYGDVPVKGLAEDRAVLRTLARTTRKETRAALERQGVTPMGRGELLARQAGAKIQRAYGLEDGVYRVALFKRLKATGMSSEEAANEVMRVLPGYDTRSPLLKAVKTSVSPFVLYPAKYIPAALDLIMQHPERWVALAAIWGGLDQMSRRKYEPIEQKDLPQNQRGLGYLLPGRIQVDALVRPAYEVLGIDIPAGDKYTFDVARWTPFSALTGSPAPGAIATQFSERIPAIFQPGGPAQDVLSIAGNRDPFTGEDILRPGMTTGEKLSEVGKRAAGLVLPSAASFQIPRVIKDMQRGDTAAAALDALGLVGLRPSVVKPGLQGIREQRKHEEAIRNIRYNIRSELRRNRDPERAQALIEQAREKVRKENERYRRVMGVQ